MTAAELRRLGARLREQIEGLRYSSNVGAHLGGILQTMAESARAHDAMADELESIARSGRLTPGFTPAAGGRA